MQPCCPPSPTPPVPSPPLPPQVQQDEHAAKKIEGFAGRITVPADAIVSHGVGGFAGRMTVPTEGGLRSQMQGLFALMCFHFLPFCGNGSVLPVPPSPGGCNRYLLVCPSSSPLSYCRPPPPNPRSSLPLPGGCRRHLLVRHHDTLRSDVLMGQAED